LFGTAQCHTVARDTAPAVSTDPGPTKKVIADVAVSLAGNCSVPETPLMPDSGRT
jgi:hypothetical protein